MSPPAGSRPKTLTFITSNANKLAEVKAILLSHSNPADTTESSASQRARDAKVELELELKSQSLELVEIQAGSVEEVARDKCVRAAEMMGGPVLTEDTALEFTALGGLPGVYIKWFLDRLGHTGLNNLLAAYEDKSAEAVCTFAYCSGPGSEPLIFQGRTRGRIVDARGDGKFGWDPIFEYEGKTYAEMEKVEKNRISHRFKALKKLRSWLLEDAEVPDE